MRAIGGAAGVGVVVASALMVPVAAQVVPDAVPALPVVSTELTLGVGRAVPQRAVPPSASYIRDIAFEEATEEVQSRGITFDFSFDSAYWMRGLEVVPGKARAAF